MLLRSECFYTPDNSSSAQDIRQGTNERCTYISEPQAAGASESGLEPGLHLAAESLCLSPPYKLSFRHLVLFQGSAVFVIFNQKVICQNKEINNGLRNNISSHTIKKC